MVSALEVAIQFMKDFGFFTVVLPFILVFTLVFALLEKTRILGQHSDARPKKNLDSMVAFVIALFVVAASNIVDVIREALPMVVLVLIMLISFLLLVGSMVAGDKPFSVNDMHKTWKIMLTIIFFISILMIFMGVIKTESGDSWLLVIWDYILANAMTGPVVSGLVLVGILIGIIAFVTSGGGSESSSE